MNRLTKTAAYVAALLAAANGWAVIVADFQADYSTPTPASGWSYLWNDNGAIGNPANYDPLSYGVGVYSPSGTGVPNPSPADYLFLGGAGDLQPGAAATQDGNVYERFVIAEFTLSSGGLATINNLTLLSSEFSWAGLDLFVNVNGDAPVYTALNAAGATLSVPTIALGSLSAGDKIYVAVGSHGDADFGDEGHLQFQINTEAVPEPTTLLLFVAGGGIIWVTRRKLVRQSKVR